MAKSSRRRRVVIVQKILTQYRHRFFELLRERLEREGIELVLIYGQPGCVDATRKDTVDLPWAHSIHNLNIRVNGREMCWQPCLHLLKGVDLVIVEQASKLLVNYVLLIQHLLGIRRMAFWGHGRNFQAHNASWLGEVVKRLISRRVHWWFSYNERSTSVIEKLGFPRQRITTVQNSIDTRELILLTERVSRDEVQGLRNELGLKGSHVGLFVGGMYREKRLGFLIEACRLIQRTIPDFEMVFVGAGPDEEMVREAANEQPWIHYVGPKFDEEKVRYFLLADVFLMPGLVGLAILDAFALEVPIVTTDVPFHSPEIEYLVPNENGIMVEGYEDVGKYAHAVIDLLSDRPKHLRLIAGCKRARNLYSIENMVDRFSQGVLSALYPG